MTTTPEENKDKEKKWPIPKTVPPKHVVIDDKAYFKCPYRGCGHMVEDMGYNPKTGFRSTMLYDPDNNIYEHVKKVHGFVWLRKGKTAGWWPLSKFHPRPNEM